MSSSTNAGYVALGPLCPCLTRYSQGWLGLDHTPFCLRAAASIHALTLWVQMFANFCRMHLEAIRASSAVQTPLHPHPVQGTSLDMMNGFAMMKGPGYVERPPELRSYARASYLYCVPAVRGFTGERCVRVCVKVILVSHDGGLAWRGRRR